MPDHPTSDSPGGHAEADLEAGDFLVTAHRDPSWTPLFAVRPPGCAAREHSGSWGV